MAAGRAAARRRGRPAGDQRDAEPHLREPVGVRRRSARTASAATRSRSSSGVRAPASSWASPPRSSRSLIGSIVGIAAGFFGGRIGGVLMRVTEWFLVIPFLPLAIVLAAILGPSVRNIILVIGITSWPSTARLIRAQVLTLKERDYVDRSRALGASNWHLMTRHILPGGLAADPREHHAHGADRDPLRGRRCRSSGSATRSNPSWGKMLDDAFETGAVTAEAWWVLRPARPRDHAGGARLHALRDRARGDPRPAAEGPARMSLLEVRDLRVTYARCRAGARAGGARAWTSSSTWGRRSGSRASRAAGSRRSPARSCGCSRGAPR